MRTISLFVLFLVFLSINAQKYSISGKVLSSLTKEGLSNVDIGFRGTHISTISEADGSFSLKDISPGEYTLFVFAMGYESQSKIFKVNNNIENIRIELDEKSENLDQVVVTATRTERNLKDIPIAVQVISGKSIDRMQLPNIRDLLEYELPGVDFKNNGGYGNINMLGFGGKYVLFLVDGVRMSGEAFDNADYNRIDMTNIERVEIVKGASSSLYGSNAIAGVINIITKRPTYPFDIQASTRVGSQGEQNYNLLVTSKQKWGRVSLSGSYKKRDPYILVDQEGQKKEFENGVIKQDSIKSTNISGYQDYSLSPKVWLKLTDKLELELRGGYYFNERHPGGQDGKKERDHFYDYTGGLKTMYSISEQQHLSISASYDKYQKYKYYKLLDEEEKKYDNTQLIISALYDLMVAGKHSLVLGTEYLSDDLMTNMFVSDGDNQNRQAQTYSLFAQQDFVLNNKVTLVGGLRMDYHSEFKGHLSPRLSAMYRPVYNITLRGGYAGGFRSPTLKELYTDWYHPYGGGFQIKGNTDLKPEISNSFNLSGEAIYGKTLLTAVAQYSILDNKIDNIWLNNDTTQYVNVGDAKVFSTEFSVSHQFNNNLHAKATYAYVHDNLGKRSIVRPHTAIFRISYSESFFKRYNSVVSFSGKYFSSLDIYETRSSNTTDTEIGIDKEQSDEYKVHYDPYSIWRLTLSQSLPYNFSLDAGINNLFNYKTKFSSFYSSISPGRTFYISLRWNLK